MLHVFILNSFAGDGEFSEKVRNELKQKTDLNYLVFNSEYAGHEELLASQICDLFPEERIRFYCCGGSGTFRNVMNGVPDISKVEFAEISLGNTNDFQAVFNKNDRERFRSIDEALDGDVLELDYINSNLGVAHNTISCGYDTNLINISSKLSINSLFSGRFIYLTAGFFALFTKSSIKAKILIDGIDYSGNYEQITIANGRMLGGTFHIGRSNDPKDGKLDIFLFPKKNFFVKVRVFIALMKYDSPYLKKRCKLLKASRIDIYMKDEKEFKGNFDGEYVAGGHLSVNVMKRKMKYIVPRGVKVEEGYNE